MAGLQKYTLTGSNGKPYKVEALDEAHADEMLKYIDSRIAAGDERLQAGDLPENTVVEGRDTAVTPQIAGTQPKTDGGKSFLDTGFGLGLRGTMTGVAAIPGLAFDAVLGEPGVTGNAINMIADNLGMKKARQGDEGRIDRLVEAAFAGLGGAGAAGVATGIGGPQALSGLTGSVSAQNSAENGGSAMDQIIAGLAGGMAPGLARTGAGATVRGVMRGSDPTRVQDVVDTFAAAGTAPTVAQATGGEKANAVEGFLSQLFGSSAPIRKNGRAREEAIGQAITGKADELYPAISNEDMGAYISSNAEEGFKPQGRAMVDRGYAMLEKQLPSDTRADMGPFLDYTGKKASGDSFASRTSKNKLLGGDQAGDWAGLTVDLQKDLAEAYRKTGQGGLPISSVKNLRTKIGNQIENAAFNESGGDIGALRGAYGVLSETLRDSATKAGPKALKAFEEANGTANWYHQMLEETKPIVDKAGGFEKVFTSSLGGMKDGGSTLRNVYSLLSPDARQAMTSQILRRAAKAPGADPEDFNMASFARNFSKMDNEAKKVVFGEAGTFREDLDKIAKTIQTVEKQKSEYGVATSAAQGRTGVQAAMQSPVYMIAGIGGGAAANHPVLGAMAGAAVPAGMLAARQVAKWMVNPKTVHFLAETTKMPKEQIPIAINQLAIQAQRENDPEMQELAEYLKSQQGDN